VPQFRERVFLIGSRDGVPFDFPDSTHGDGKDGDLLSTAHEPYRTAWDALGDLPYNPNEPSLSIGGKWGELLPSIPEGQNYLWHTRRGGGIPPFQAQPGPIIGPFHWTNRKLTTHEMCRLQTFPDGLTFDCGRTGLQKMLGNAVPSLVTEVLACSIRRRFFADERPPSPCGSFHRGGPPCLLPRKLLACLQNTMALSATTQIIPARGWA
jgi:DNA (cytosine-5)-methyltransferase 1